MWKTMEDPAGPAMIFSHRHHRAFTAGGLSAALDDDLRRKLRAQLLKHNEAAGVQREPNERWGGKFRGAG